MKNSLFLTLLFCTLVTNVQAFDFEPNPENDKYAAEGPLLQADFDTSEVIPVVQSFWSTLYSTATSAVTRIGHITSSENYKHKPKPQPQKEVPSVVTLKSEEVPAVVITPTDTPTELTNPIEPITEPTPIFESHEPTPIMVADPVDDTQVPADSQKAIIGVEKNVPFTNVRISPNSAIIAGIAVVAAVGLTYILHKKGYLQKLYSKIKEQPAVAAGIASILIGGAVAASYCYSC